MNKPRIFALALIALAAACGGSVVVDVPASSGTGGDGTSTGLLTTVVSATSSTSVSSGTGGSPQCWQDPNQDCSQCCVDQNPGAYEQFVSIVLKLCACGSPMMKCFQACSDPNENTCADLTFFGQACVDCINDVLANGDSCGPQAQNFCFNDPSCGPVLDCLGTCP
ncbi:Hypothetical protein A7982_08395 [Minicystis rosea]|nr:Hypothetical protein A7982_08395 [Minicystis rosea]